MSARAKKTDQLFQRSQFRITLVLLRDFVKVKAKTLILIETLTRVPLKLDKS